MTVAFSDSIIIPANYTSFNDAFLGIRLILGQKALPGENKTLTGWQIVAFRPN